MGHVVVAFVTMLFLIIGAGLLCFTPILIALGVVSVHAGAVCCLAAAVGLFGFLVLDSFV